MDAAVSGIRSSYGGREEEPLTHHRQRMEGDIAIKFEKGGKENQMKMEISLSGELDSSSTSSLNKNEQNDRLATARAEMGEVKEENKRLKMYLERIMTEYKALEMQVRETNKTTTTSPSLAFDTLNEEEHHHTSLSLGPTLTSSNSLEKRKMISKNCVTVGIDKEHLELSLNCETMVKAGANPSEIPTNASSNSPIHLSSENSFEDQKEETNELRPNGRVEKRSGDDEVSQQNTAAKKTRVSVRARCDTPTMHDGCQWRKYGQKISKGNPCPRAYYRCTIAPSCPVRKQVQRCADDMSILITTYEGTHNHPLPVSATVMASTTSAAASMLLSGSSSSNSHQGLTPNATTDLHGLNFYLSDPSRSKQFYLPNTTSMSSAPTHPTITLDLTNNPNSASPHFSQFGSSVYSPVPARSYNMSTSVSFGPLEPTTSLPISWGNYGSAPPKTQPQETYLNNNHLRQESIAAATKAITTNPNFQTALATALKSIIGGSAEGGGDGLAQRSRWNNENLINSIRAHSALQAAAGCGSSFLNNSTLPAGNSQQLVRNLVYAQPASLPLSNPNKGSSMSPQNDNSKLL